MIIQYLNSKDTFKQEGRLSEIGRREEERKKWQLKFKKKQIRQNKAKCTSEVGRTQCVKNKVIIMIMLLNLELEKLRHTILDKNIIECGRVVF